MRGFLPERIGFVAGGLAAPVSALVSVVRRGRTLHPRGEVYAASVRAAAWKGPPALAAHRLAGPALVRVSPAFWRAVEWPDLLGLAVRFRSSPTISPDPSPGDQDLLFATVRHPWTLPFAPLTTEPHDFLANDYYAVSPFEDPDLGRVRFRLRSPGPQGDAPDRWERLRRAAEGKRAVFLLEARGPRTRDEWIPLARIALTRRIQLDQDRLRFDPARDGRGIVPRGFIHALRPGTYAGSRAVRSIRERRRRRQATSTASRPGRRPMRDTLR